MLCSRVTKLDLSRLECCSESSAWMAVFPQHSAAVSGTVFHLARPRLVDTIYSLARRRLLRSVDLSLTFVRAPIVAISLPPSRSWPHRHCLWLPWCSRAVNTQERMRGAVKESQNRPMSLLGDHVHMTSSLRGREGGSQILTEGREVA